jgi:hypothetical protein
MGSKTVQINHNDREIVGFHFLNWIDDCCRDAVAASVKNALIPFTVFFLFTSFYKSLNHIPGYF